MSISASLISLLFMRRWHHTELQVFNMASSRVLEREVQEQPRRAAAASIDFCSHKYSLLIVIGRTAQPRQTGHISREIERGKFHRPQRPDLICNKIVRAGESCWPNSPQRMQRCKDCSIIVILFNKLTADASSSGAPASASHQPSN